MATLTEVDQKSTHATTTLQLIADKSQSRIGLSHYLALSIWVGWIGFYIYLPILLPVLWLICPYLLYLLLLGLTISAFYPIHEKAQPKWTKAIAQWIMKKAEEYFQMRVYCEDYEAFRAIHPAIIALEPHDVLPIGLFILSDHLGYAKPHTNRGCMTSAIFRIPGMRHIYSWATATSVSKRNIQRLLRKGITPGICPGGVQEVTYLTTPESDECILFLRSRLGLIKLAAEFGTPIIPTFTFNQRRCFDFWIPQWPWIQRLGKKIGFIPLIIFGVFGIPFAIPKPVPMVMVIGKPIPVPKMTTEDMHGKKEELEKYLLQLIASIEHIFETYKHEFYMGDIKLIIK